MADYIQTSQKRTAKSTNILAALNTLDQGKLPPQAIEVERLVLGAFMLDENAQIAVGDILRPEFFYLPEHQIIFKTISELIADSRPIDILTVSEHLKKKGELEAIGGVPYISALTNRVSSSAHIEFHTKIVQEKFIQRELIKTAAEITKEAFSETADIIETLDRAEQKLLDIGDANFHNEYQDIHLLVSQVRKDIEEASKMQDSMSGVPSGFTELDKITNGWQKGNLIIIAARPAMGKTAFALSMARNMAVDFKRPVAFFSLEMTAVELVGRLVSSESEIKGEQLKRGELSEAELERLVEKSAVLSDAPLYINDSSAITMYELRAQCRRLKQKHKIEAVFIDYLQLMQGSGMFKGGTREQEISQISRQLKSLAKELSIPVIALAQLSRQVETRGGDKQPQLSDLRESGAIEQDADIVSFIYRPEYYNITEDEKGNSTLGKSNIIVAKHRNGSTGKITLRWINNLARFENIEHNTALLPQTGHSTITIPSKMNEDVPF
ncbi:MAG: replicative DNA helicase [Bacteroidales bacterium]|jgi:replicative DNA helicase|nr:replicative DNA helicase [Bacteroidales bacterium]